MIALAVDIRVKPYASTEYYAVCGLLAAAGWSSEAIPSRLTLRAAEDQETAYVVRSPAKVIGYARIISDGALVSYLAEIVVDPSWQKHGVGTALLKACAKRFPTARLDLLSTERAQPFYERTGFTAKAGYRRWP